MPEEDRETYDCRQDLAAISFVSNQAMHRLHDCLHHNSACDNAKKLLGSWDRSLELFMESGCVGNRTGTLEDIQLRIGKFEEAVDLQEKFLEGLPEDPGEKSLSLERGAEEMLEEGE